MGYGGLPVRDAVGLGTGYNGGRSDRQRFSAGCFDLGRLPNSVLDPVKRDDGPVRADQHRLPGDQHQPVHVHYGRHNSHGHHGSKAPMKPLPEHVLQIAEQLDPILVERAYLRAQIEMLYEEVDRLREPELFTIEE